MNMRIFSKRHPEAISKVQLKPHVRQRIWHLILDLDPIIGENISEEYWTPSWDGIRNRILREYGWEKLHLPKSSSYQYNDNSKDFILNGKSYSVLDAVEIYYYELSTLIKKDNTTYEFKARLFQQNLNAIFEDDNLPWRMMDGRIVKLDSKWVEVEILGKVHELISIHGFEGALQEFLDARSSVTSGDAKNAIMQANLALESTMKGILGVQDMMPKDLIRKLIASGLVPEYSKGFLNAFQEYILRCVPVVRNEEPGVAHGQGVEINDPPLCLAELAVNLSGVLILYLMKKHTEKNAEISQAIDPVPPTDSSPSL
jgi:hypothetical protein